MQFPRHMRSPGTLAGALALVLITLAPAAHSDLIPSPFLPLTADQLTASNAFIGGTFDCSTEGTYDADSFDLDLSGECLATGYVEGGTNYLGVSIQAMLDSVVDNSGVLIAGGEFSMSGIIPGLGINVDTLLATGTVIDVEYGNAAIGRHLQSLIALDFVADPLGHIGDLLYWGSNTSVSGWVPGLEWQSSVDPSDFSNFTGSQYFFSDASVILAEPAGLVLFGFGLAIVGFSLRKRRRSR